MFYIHRESQGHMEMALGGFSGRATRLLARLLARRGEEFWPPVYEGQGIQIGAFVVKFDASRTDRRPTTCFSDRPATPKARSSASTAK